MTSREFCYWLHGFFESKGGGAYDICLEQTRVIERNLATVFEEELPYPAAINTRLRSSSKPKTDR